MKIKRITAFALLMIILTSFLAAQARYTYISTLGANISNSGNWIDAEGAVSASGYYPCSLKVELQQRNSDYTWKTINTWTDTGDGPTGVSIWGTYYVASKNWYRAKVTGTIYTESDYVYSHEIYIS